MKPERLNYWAEVFEGKAWEYDLAATAILQDDDLTRDTGRDFAETMAAEFRQKVARARKVAARLRSEISNWDTA